MCRRDSPRRSEAHAIITSAQKRQAGHERELEMLQLRLSSQRQETERFRKFASQLKRQLALLTKASARFTREQSQLLTH